jgi:hypothetical protein
MFARLAPVRMNRIDRELLEFRDGSPADEDFEAAAQASPGGRRPVFVAGHPRFIRGCSQP